MNALAEMCVRDFAKRNRCPDPSPAMLEAMARMWRKGIEDARAGHRERKKQLSNLIASPLLREGYFNLFRPVPFLSMHETVEFYRDEIERLRSAPQYRRDLGKIRMAKERLVLARFFRRNLFKHLSRRSAA